MRVIMIAAALILAGTGASAQPLTATDRGQIQRLPQRFTQGWLKNSRAQVMSLFAPEAVFLPHDGLRPYRGKPAINQFWFPTTGAAGTVTAFTMTVDNLSGESDHAIIWGKSDLH